MGIGQQPGQVQAVRGLRKPEAGGRAWGAGRREGPGEEPEVRGLRAELAAPRGSHAQRRGVPAVSVVLEAPPDLGKF